MSVHVRDEFGLEVADVGDGNFLQQSARTAEDDGDLLFYLVRSVLRLFQDFHVTYTFVEDELGGGIHIGAELGEGFHLAVLRLVEFQGASHFLHGLDLGVTADT